MPRGNQYYCAANPLTGTTYQWFNGNMMLPGETGPSITVNSDGVYWMAAVSDKGCTDTSQKIKVIVHPQPEAIIEPFSDDIICAHDTLSLKAGAGGADDYRWEPAKPFRMITGAEGRAVTGIFIEPATWVTLTVYNQFGCQDTATALVVTKPCCEVFVPNAFSPNGDGLNEFFNPQLQLGQILISMQVFDRWGKLVYNNTNIKKGWDGNYEDGTKALSDTYMYFIKYTCSDGKLYEQKEAVSLIR